jgi:plasmid replication initiation protein
MIKRQDENGNYRLYDPNTNRFLDDAPLQPTTIGQVEHQTTITERLNVVDVDEFKSAVVDEYGLAVQPDDELKLKQFIKEAISVENLIETFNENSHETLLKLLALQDNKHPLKKGGIGIAYRTDALIMHCKMEFSAEENVVFDAILGTMSSLPQNASYMIAPSDFKKYSRYESEKTLFRTFRNGCEKLKKRHLVFDQLGPDGEDDIEIPWFNILRYHNSKKDEQAFIEFVPSDFFKDLALCSQLVHGAYAAMEVTTQLRGKYTIALYYFLESKKNYKAYPSATPGVFEMSMEELKHQFSIPQSYQKTDMERRVLKPAQESINNVPECDFTFEYTPKTAGGAVVGYIFNIKNKLYIDLKENEVEITDVEEDAFFEQVKMLFTISKVEFSDEEIERITSCAKKQNKDSAYMMQIITAFKQRIDNKSLGDIDDKVGYICRMIQNGANPKAPLDNNDKAKNKFNNFKQRDYDMDELERKLIGH